MDFQDRRNALQLGYLLEAVTNVGRLDRFKSIEWGGHVFDNGEPLGLDYIVEV
jgi:hypothetical protein